MRTAPEIASGAGAGRGAVAQEATPVVAPGGVHPVVGSWLADTDTDDPGNPPALFTFHADGTYLEYDPGDDDTGVGAWAATGERTADLTIVYVDGNDAGASLFTVRAAVEVAADGQSFTASYTVEITAADGTRTGEYGPGTATGTRIGAEGPGEPVGTFEDLFAQFEEAEGTPAA